jgi:ADP-ribosylglycohydrolase
VTDVEDRVLGCIVGGAIGDALGGPYEGQPGPISVQPDAPWRLSDDTQLTLATCEAVAICRVVSPAAIAARFAHWFSSGRITGVGASTLKALRDLASGAHWALAGRKGEQGAGNGAAMRAAPLGFCLDPAVPEQRTTLRDVCRITHHNDGAYAGALAVVLAVRAVSAQAWHPGDDLLLRVAESLPDTSVRDRLRAVGEVAPGTPAWEVARRFGCSGYVADSVPLALFAAQQAVPGNFRDVVLGAVGAGGDSDTIASMAGQVAGAWAGFSGLPGELVEQLPQVEQVLAIARAFAAAVAVCGSESAGGDDV